MYIRWSNSLSSAYQYTNLYRNTVSMLSVTIVIEAALLGVFLCNAVTDEQFEKLQGTVDEQLGKLQATVDEQLGKLQGTVENQMKTMISLARQVSQQQLHVEEMTRSSGDSGLKLVRLTRTGSKPYFSSSYGDHRLTSIHEHSNTKRTVGMGEFIGVLNGVEFRTRHNDYKMNMPSTTSTDYGLTEDIPYPDVPPEVTSQQTVELQIEEMRKWFKAWKDGDHSTRDYRKYFKANICYLEGMWTNADGNSLDESFSSDRHFLDAKSFFDLQSKISYTSKTGRKSSLENFAYLPTTIAEVSDEGSIVYSQWNYKILCHPVQNYDVPLDRLQLEDDLGIRVASGRDLETFSMQRCARFSLKQSLRPDYASLKNSFVKLSEGTFLDKLMAEIPGKDNYPANVTDDFQGETAFSIDTSFLNSKEKAPVPLNAGFYHNAYKVLGKDAMGVSSRRRGFSDNNLYVAYNSQPKITPTRVTGKCGKEYTACLKEKQRAETKCERLRRNNPDAECENVTCVCPDDVHRVSYAIPLELIYTTPLQSWNPYNLKYFPEKNGPRGDDGKRNGGNSPEEAFLGYSDVYYTMTPMEFFESGTDTSDPADTTRKKGFSVLDPSGTVRQMLSSGISIITRNIPGVGPMRIRYPIMPLHDTGSSIYKDLKALTDMTLKKHKYIQLYPDVRSDNGTLEQVFTFETTVATRSPPGPHVHTFELTQSEIDLIKSGEYLTVTTSEMAGHDHEMILRWNSNREKIQFYRCDGMGRICWDGHTNSITCPDCPFGVA